MKTIYYCLVVLLFTCISCAPPKWSTIGASTIHKEWEVTGGGHIKDSVLKYHNLPSLNKWYQSRFKDFETGKYLKRYVFIKDSLNCQLIYICLEYNDMYTIKKRVETYKH